MPPAKATAKSFEEGVFVEYVLLLSEEGRDQLIHKALAAGSLAVAKAVWEVEQGSFPGSVEDLPADGEGGEK